MNTAAEARTVVLDTVEDCMTACLHEPSSLGEFTSRLTVLCMELNSLHVYLFEVYVPAGVSRNKFKHLIKGTLLWRYILLFTIHYITFQFWTVYYLRQGGYVMPGVCLSVCVSICLYVCWQLYVKTTERVFMKISPQTYNVNKTKLIKFWKSNASGSGSRDCLKDSSTLRDGVFFHNFGSYLRREWS